MTKNFESLGITPKICELLHKQGVDEPTAIQAQAIPPLFKGRDILAQAQTGTGKTFAFLLPSLQQIKTDIHAEQVLVMAPTRELARQIADVADTLAPELGIDVLSLIGGKTIENQLQKLHRHPHVIIGTPGRLLDHCRRHSLDLSSVRRVIVDEADQMLQAGFLEDVDTLIGLTPKRRQLLFFSATVPDKIKGLAKKHMQSPLVLNILEGQTIALENIEQRIYMMTEEQKLPKLCQMLTDMNPYLAIVFCNTKERTSLLAGKLIAKGFNIGELHGDMSQGRRNQVLRDFAKAKTQILVATDIAARGIDISELSHVFNYDLPEVPETYVHRIGRTARAGADGTAVSFCAPEEKEYLAGIEKLNRRQIPVVSGHPWDGVPAPVKAAPPVRGKKPKAEAEQPEKPVKAEKPAAPKKEKAAAKQPSPKNTEPKEGTSMEENQKRTSGGRSENRRSNNSRTRRESNAPQPANRGSNAQPKFDPHFVSAPEATPLRPVKKAPAAQPAAKQTAPAQNGQRQRGGQPARAEQRTDRNDPRTEQRAERNARNARSAQNSQNQQGSRNAVQSSRPARPAKSEAPRGRSRNAAPARDEDPGLMLISRRPPQQKFTNFEEYMTAHGGATAPIEDHTDET